MPVFCRVLKVSAIVVCVEALPGTVGIRAPAKCSGGMPRAHGDLLENAHVNLWRVTRSFRSLSFGSCLAVRAVRLDETRRRQRGGTFTRLCCECSGSFRDRLDRL